MDADTRQRITHGGEFGAPDGTTIAYGLTGQGPPMVLTNGLTTSTGFWRYLRPHWARTHRVLTWDLPGHGDSAPAHSPAAATIAGQPDILMPLMDSVGMDAAVQVGWSTGCQVVLECYRRYPARCRALVLLLGSAGRVLSTAQLPLPGEAIDWLVQHTPGRLFAGLTRAVAGLAGAPGGQWLPRRLGLIGHDTTVQDAAAITAHLGRVHPATVQSMVASAQAHDAWALLPKIEVPVLIVAGDQDPFAPSERVALHMHAQCPNSELLRLPEGTHTALLDHAEQIRDAVDDFVRRRCAGASVNPGA